MNHKRIILGLRPVNTIWSVFVMDPISAFMGRLIADYTKLRPIHITILSFLMSIVSAYFFLQGDYKSILLAVLVFQISNILDNIDGLLARIKLGSGSVLGLVLDHTLDPWRVILNILALCYTVYSKTNDNGIFILALLFLCIHFMDWTLPRTINKIRGAYETLYSPNIKKIDFYMIKLKDIFSKVNLKVIFFGTHEREILVLGIAPILSMEHEVFFTTILVSLFFFVMRLMFDIALLKNEIVNNTKEYLGDSFNPWEGGVKNGR
ncbi:MAG: CDP-alcohol phosphatidyltransferase family protein [Rhodothermaceae bacterium]